MKKFLTLIIPEATQDGCESPAEAEILSVDDQNTLGEAVKQAKGKYCIISGGDLLCDLPEEFFKTLDDSSADILAFDGSYLIKTSLIKGAPLKNLQNKFCAEIFACLSAKTVSYSPLTPFTVHPAKYSSDETETGYLCEALDEFKKKKEKLTKEVYSFTFELICGRLCSHYADALIAGRTDKQEIERLKEFDALLKDNIVLYLALEKRFKPVNLNKLRKNNFKIGLLEYSKLKKSRKSFNC